MASDLNLDALARIMPGRSIRSYPALLSTEADAMAWARAGAPSGALVVADYQAAARGRGGLPWRTSMGEGLSFSLVVRPELPAAREGWCYVVGSVALADVLADKDVVARWPDAVARAGAGEHVASLGVHARVEADHVAWAVVSVLITEAPTPRGSLLGRCITALESRLQQADAAVLDDYRSRCTTLGQSVRARLIPMGPDGVEVIGEAVDFRSDGALVVRTAAGSRVAVRPQDLGVLEEAAEGAS